MSNLRALCVAAVAGVFAATSSLAQSPIKVGYVPVTDYLPAYVAKEKGIFEKHKLNVELVRTPLIANIPPALVTGSLQIGITTGPGFLQATEGGLDFVAVAAGARQPETSSTVSLVAAANSGIAKAADLKGRKIGVPGINSLLDVMFRKWLLINNVRPSEVQIIEAGFPVMADLLRGKQLDAVLVIEPFRARILEAGIGIKTADYLNEVAKSALMSFYMADRKWATQNIDAARSFRSALKDGITFIRDNENDAREVESKYLGLNARFAPNYTTEMDASDLKFYQDLGKELGLLKGNVDTQTLFLN